jgi:Mor family transcriptional regulator
MKKSDWQYIVGTLIFICIIEMAVIGFLMGLVISKDPLAPESTRYFLGLQRHYWGNIHFYLSIAFVVLSLIHLIISWDWIKGKAHQLFHRGWLPVLVLAVVVLFLVFSLFWAFSPKAPRAYEDYGGKADSGVITDQMTLLDVEKATGIPAKEIAEALGLPSKIPLNETLRQLRKSYPLTLQEVRNVVTELLNKKEVKIKEEVKPKELLHIGPNRRLVRGRMASVPSGILITGKMTLYDLEDITGIPARKIANELGIPSNALLNEHLGRLRRRYRFSMQEVRNVVASLMKKNRKKNKK